MQRENIGIKEIDNMIEGGIPKGGIIGLSGPPGVGKSIFSLHFLLEGARQGKKSVYINLEEPRKNIDNMIKEFDFSEEFFDFEKKGLIVIRCFSYSEYEQIQVDLLEKINKDKKIGRLVIDSFNCFFNSIDDSDSSENNVRRLITNSFNYLRKKDTTILLILEKQNVYRSLDYNIPYLIDGMIELDFLDLGIIERRIFIPKMRWTNQYRESKGYDIGSKGIEMFVEE